MIEFFSALADLARPLLAAAGLGGAAWWLGSTAGRALWTQRRGDERIGRAGVDVALGLALLAALGFWLGICGWLTFWGLVGGVAVVAAGLLAISPRRKGPGRRQAPPLRLSAPRGAVLLVVLLPLVALALYPPTGFDTTMYHLPFARAFVATGGLPFLADLRFPIFPQASEVLFAEAMILDGDRAAQLLSLIATLSTAAILFGWAKRVSAEGGEGRASGVGELAAALFLGGPIVAYLSGTAYCEPVLVLFGVAAFDQIDRFDAAPDDPRRWGLAGIFAGSAAGVKYFGLFPVGAVLAVALFARAEGKFERFRRLAWSFGGVLLFALSWYVRNAVYTGNPFFPLFARLFGESVWGGPAELAPWSEGNGHSQLIQMLRLPWTLTFGRPEFGRMPPWSPVLILALAATLLALWRNRRIRLLLGASLAYLGAFLFLPIDARYLLPIVPLLSLAAALSLAPRLGPHRLMLPAAVLLALAPAWLWSLYHLHRQGPLPASPAAREVFLADRFPAYPALRFLARTEGSAASVYGFYAENHAYYAPGRYQGDWRGRTPYSEILKLLTSGDLLAEGLRARGVTHLLTIVAAEPPLPRDPSFAQRFQLVYDDGKARVWKIL
ncbi:MAG: hypothetical protein ABJC13_07730 [Acidobacteriota bacterium]